MSPERHIRCAKIAWAAHMYYLVVDNKVDSWMAVLAASCHAAAAGGKLLGPAIYTKAPDGTDIGARRR